MSRPAMQYVKAWSTLPVSVRGAVWAMAGAASFTTMGALVKALSNDVPAPSIIFFRNAFSLLVLALWIVATHRTARFRTKRILRHFFRAVAGVASFACLIVAYKTLDFALAAALAYTTPFWVIVLSIVFIGERPGLRRSLATLLGFFGVLVIIRPLPVWELGVWAALASAALGGTAVSFSRHLIRLEPTETLLFYFFLFGGLITAGPAIISGFIPDPHEILLLMLISISGMAGLGFASNAFGIADATIVAPFDFIRLPLASVIGLAAFSEVPDAWLLIGSSIMIVALYLIVVPRPRS
jgi:drug/metabolite transporter (DMT)-like permease